MAKSPEELAATMVRNLKEKTGKDLPGWLRVVKAAKLDKHGAIVKMLKTEHDVTHGFANMIAHEFLQSAAAGIAAGGTDLVDAQYAGDKADLRPIYDALEKAVKKFGKDVEFAPKKAYVSLRRNKQFGLIQPSTKTRVDLGLVLKGVAPKGRLEAAGSFNSMVTHRVRLEAKGDVDAAVLGWLRQAYDAG
jgi:hypothetical protein